MLQEGWTEDDTVVFESVSQRQPGSERRSAAAGPHSAVAASGNGTLSAGGPGHTSSAAPEGRARHQVAIATWTSSCACTMNTAKADVQ